MNLSVGWEPWFGGDEAVGEMLTEVEAVYGALEHAACSGALAIAAAGNFPGGPEPVSGPIYPAGWETRQAPACTDGDGDYRPLVFAVGGVRQSNGPLANSRHKSRPRLAALADHAVVRTPKLLPVEPTATLTGSSVATAVVSAAAAARWRASSAGTTAFQVMDSVYGQSTAQVAPAADFCVGGSTATSCGAAKRVRVCEAAGLPCKPGPAPPVYASVELSDVVVNFNQTGAPLLTGVPAQLMAFECPPAAIQSMLKLKEETLHVSDAGAFTKQQRDPCPHWQFYGHSAEAWTGPQPDNPPCPSCTFKPGNSPGTLYVEFDNPWGVANQNVKFTSPTLKVGDHTYALPVRDARPGDAFRMRMELLPDQLGEPIALVVTVNSRSASSPHSALSPVLVLPPDPQPTPP